MFRSLYNVLKKEDLLEQSYDQAEQALSIASELYLNASAIVRKGAASSLNSSSKLKDVQQLEMDIRRKSLTHLSLNGEEDLSPTLVLVTIIHDIERLATYSVSMSELSEKAGIPLQFGDQETDMQTIETLIKKSYDRLTNNFDDLDKESARQYIDDLRSSKNRCDEMIEHIFSADPFDNHATGYAAILYIRYTRQIAHHLANIATSYVNPYDRIGFDE